MTISPPGVHGHGGLFTQKFIYLGIYTQKGFKDELVYSFGNIGESKLMQAFGNESHRGKGSKGLDLEALAKATSNPLAQFKEEMQKKIQGLMDSMAERELFF